MKKLYDSAKKGDLKSFTLIFVASLFIFVALATFFFLMFYAVSRTRIPGPAVQHVSNPPKKQQQAPKMDVQKLNVGEVTGVVSSIDDDKVTIRTSVYGEPEHDITVALEEEQQKSMVKYEMDEDSSTEGLPQATEKSFDYENLQPGDLLTLRFSLEVPLEEIGAGEMQIDQIIVDDEYDPEEVVE